MLFVAAREDVCIDV